MSFVSWHDLAPMLPEIFVLCMASLILLADAFIAEGHRFITYAATQVTLLGAVLLTAQGAHGETVTAFHGLFIEDPVADVLKLMLYVSISAMLVYSKSYLQVRGLFRGEFFVLVLFAALGMMIMISAGNFLALYLGLELQALCLYALVALSRDSAVATEAALKYFVLGALASGLLLYGMSMVYGVTGHLDLSGISAVLAHGVKDPTVLVFGLVFLVAGLAFKLGVVPFHMWVPDVYQGAPTAMTLFIGTAPKIAAFGFVIRLLVGGLQPLAHDWSGMLVILSVLSIAIGNITAIAQSNIKRMLAYSTISHMGFVLLGFLSGNLQGYGAAMFYVLVYVLMSLGAFGMVMLLSRQGFEAEHLDDFKGLNQRSPWYAFLMLVVMFSMAGIPPTAGFYAKLAVLSSALDAGYVGLVVAAVLFSVVGAFYYLRIVKLMYFDAPSDPSACGAHADVGVLMSANGLAVLALGIFPQPLMALCTYSIWHSL